MKTEAIFEGVGKGRERERKRENYVCEKSQSRKRINAFDIFRTGGSRNR